MNEQPLVSIICLCYNHGDFVREALDSVVNQDYKNIEIIVVDDNSSDHSKEIIEQWLKVHPEALFINNLVNLGNTKAFNSALNVSNGEYIIDFATDDVMLTNCISELVQKTQTSTFKNVGAVHCNAKLIDEKGKETGYFFTEKDTIPVGQIYHHVVNSGTIICPVAMLVSRKVYETVGSYDENLKYEDVDFWIRSSRLFDYEYVDAILCKKRVLPNSLGSQYNQKSSKRANEINYSTFTILKKAFENTNRFTIDDRALLKRIHYEMFICYETQNFRLFLKYISLELKVRFKKRNHEVRQ